MARKILTASWQCLTVAFLAAIGANVTVQVAHEVNNAFGSIPITITSPDLWVFLLSLSLWIAASVHFSRAQRVVMAARVLLWLLIAPMAYIYLVVFGVMHILH